MNTAPHHKEEETVTYNKHFLIDSFTTEFNSSLKLFISPFKALKTMSLDPIKEAMKNSIDESEKFIARHTPPDYKP